MDLLNLVEEVKQETKKEVKKKVKTQEKKEEKTYTFPFEIYLAAEKKDVSYIFQDGEEYKTNEITKLMLEHGFYEFAGSVTYDYMEKDNVLVPIFQQHKKG